MTPLWFSNLVFWAAQVALLVLAAGFLPRLFQIRQPRVLLGYWRALLAIALALPFLQPWHRMPSLGVIVFAPDVSGAAFSPPSNPTISPWHFPNVQLIAQFLAALILVGVATRFLFLAFGLLKLRRFRQASSPVPVSSESFAILEDMRTRLHSRAEFRFSSDVDSPVTFGFAAPVILLPERFPSLDARFQAAIACHELLHVRRRDWAHHVAEEIVRAAFWFHPAIAWLIARVRLAREQVVDLEVIRITQARKPYLEALLEFTAGRTRAAAVPAPPFLAERQLAERVALMLKEVHMSRKRLVASLTVIVCCLALAITLVARTFPLKSAAPAPQSAPQGGVGQAVSGGVAGGVSGGVGGGVSGGTAATLPAHGVEGGINGGIGNGSSSTLVGAGSSASGDIPTVYSNTIWTDTVKRGSMVRQVRGLGTLVRAEDSAGLVARIALPVVQSADVKPHQNATIDTRKGLVKGHVTGINASSSDGTRTVYVSLDETLPEGAGTGLPIDATIDIEKLDNVLYVGRPVHGAANTSISLFKIAKDGLEAQRVTVKLGRSSVNTIEVLDGLKEGDKIILSDMANWDNIDRLQIK